MTDPFYSEDYYERAKNLDSIKLLFVGKDPYRTNPTGIPFCKTNIDELKNKTCSGYYLLHGFGIDVDTERRSPEAIFTDLLCNQKIVVINSVYEYLENKAPTEAQIVFAKAKNEQFIRKAQHVWASKGAYKLLKKYFTPQHIKVVCHPDIRNFRLDEHKLLWRTMGGVINCIN